MIMKKTAVLALLGSALLPCAAPAADIVALLIGNNAYTLVEDQLDTPVNDAQLMKRTLEALPGGADVALLTDATKEQIEIALNALKARAQGAKLALVYYSGHGTEDQPEGFSHNETFLLPVDAKIPDVNYLPTRAVSLATVLAALKAAPVTARAVILDCCRDGARKATAALAGSTKSFGNLDERVKKSLGSAVVPDATLIAFAASPGRKAAAFLTAADENSPFTKFLTDELATGTGNLRDLVEAAAETTETRTARRQVPYVSYMGAASAIRQIVFRRSPAAAMAAADGKPVGMPMPTPLQKKIVAAKALAKVTHVEMEQGFIAMNAGSKQGITQGQQLEVRRGNAVIARLRVANTVDESESIADFEPSSIPSGITIQKGDEVIRPVSH